MVAEKPENSFCDLETLERLGRARAFIDHCYDHPLNLDQISEKACFSRYQYLTERRIEKAKELLTADDLRVTDVCFEVGFQSLGSFSSLFHKWVGHAPASYRERARARELAKRKVPGCFLVMYRLEG